MNYPATHTTHERELVGGQRFAFGDNWSQFLKVVDEERIERAVGSLRNMLDTQDLRGKSFLDVGSGSGLFSLAAKRLGAHVCSFDYDPQSVACTEELKRRYYDNDDGWHIHIGSVLDEGFLQRLGKFDVVYSWGVLHHTGDMWTAMANVVMNVAPGGTLFLALYNDQGRASQIWWTIKKAYVGLPTYLRWLMLIPCYVVGWGPATIRDIVILRPFRTWRTYKLSRGMSPHRDLIDWVGGFPFEVATPEQVFDFYKRHGYRLSKLRTCAGSLGCNEFVFQRN